MGEIVPLQFDREELAWAAGFFDGEGSTNPQRHRVARERSKVGYFSVSVQISQIDSYVLERFQRAVGGRGKVKGPYKNRGPNGVASPQYGFFAQSFEDAQHVIAVLWPWLSPVKREQARRSLRLYVDSCEGRKSFYVKRRSDGRCAMGHPVEERTSYGVCLACVRERQRRERQRRKNAAL